MKSLTFPFRVFLLLFLIAGSAEAQSFANFEARQVRPVALTPDGETLLAVNSPASSLSIFDASHLSSRPSPLLIGEVPVGLEPVSVRARTNGEAWVVNELSDSVTIVSLADGSILETLQVPDEPADVHFAAGKAFVTCSRNRLLRVFDAVTRVPFGSIPLDGLDPRAITSNADGSRIYVAFLLSGNGTTILPRSLAPAPPAPTNSALPAAPQTALIVSASDPRINYTVLDHDVAEIDTSTLTVTRYLGGAGTHPFDLAIRPGTGELWVANSESMNLIRFEPRLRGNFSRHRLTALSLANAAPPVIHDLNPGIDHTVLPNEPAKAIALAQPTSIVFNNAGTRAWTAAFDSDRVAEVDAATGAVLGRVDVRTGGGDSTVMRGPRGLAISSDGSRLYSLNKISNTLTTIHTAACTVIGEIPLGSVDPTPASVRAGRGFLFDARLSGNGTTSCATCHLDGERDGLAWDLGDPGGGMITLQGANLSGHNLTLRAREVHPMKGPMMTQTLRGLASNISGVTVPAAAVTTKFHWRGDKPSIQSFNSTFSNLLGGNMIPAASMDALAAYLLTIPHHPNPNRNPDRTLSTSVNGANALKGRDLFNAHAVSHCIVCHPLPSGTDHNIDLKREVNGTQEMKNPPLRTVYQRAGIFSPVPGGSSLSGFGLGSDGTGHELPRMHFYQLDALNDGPDTEDLAAFILSFDTGTAPAVGRGATVNPLNRTSAAVLAEIALLEGQASGNNCDLVVQGRLGGVTRHFRFSAASSKYGTDRSSSPALLRAELLNLLTAGDSITFLGVAPGTGARLGGDRDGDGVLDGDELPPVLDIATGAGNVLLTWPTAAADWFPQTSADLGDDWMPLTDPPQVIGSATRIERPLLGDSKRFFRLHRTW